MRHILTLSPLGHTWLIDLDGCVLEHNGHLHGEDVLLPGVKDFWAAIPKSDAIIILTSRTEPHAEATRNALLRFGLRHDRIIFGLPFGERILINDRKPSGLKTAHAINVTRDEGLEACVGIKVDPHL